VTDLGPERPPVTPRKIMKEILGKTIGL